MLNILSSFHDIKFTDGKNEIYFKILFNFFVKHFQTLSRHAPSRAPACSPYRLICQCQADSNKTPSKYSTMKRKLNNRRSYTTTLEMMISLAKSMHNNVIFRVAKRILQKLFQIQSNSPTSIRRTSDMSKHHFLENHFPVRRIRNNLKKTLIFDLVEIFIHESLQKWLSFWFFDFLFFHIKTQVIFLRIGILVNQWFQIMSNAMKHCENE